MDLDSVEKALGALGLTLKSFVAGAAASFASLRFFDGEKMPDGTLQPMRPLHKWMTFAGGWALAAWGGAPLTAYLELGQKVEIGVVLIVGLFGMAAASEFIKFVRQTDWGALISLLRKKGGER